MKIPLVEVATEKAAEALEKRLRILIAGGRSGNFPDSLRADARLEFWDSTDASQTKKPKAIPIDVGCVLLTRFIDHKLSDRLKADAEKHDIPLVGPLPNGQITDLLQRALFGLTKDESEDEVALSIPEEEPKRVDYSGLANFLIGQIDAEDLSAGLLENGAELGRLRSLASEEWPGISPRRVHKTLRRALYRLGALKFELRRPAKDAEDCISTEPRESESETARLRSELAKRSTALELCRRKLHKASSENGALKRAARAAQQEAKKLEKELEKTQADIITLCVFMHDLLPQLAPLGLHLSLPKDTDKELARIFKENIR
ncbi:MAG: hypothetical protein COU09_01120 [Candidatus Harrisonbacteria bacterium CG10_big_fil_rev_8_21_14_0_10_44_23]|uniref:Uncharacterized protein n=1 Tax=Candidatus Harrisonbacteria bacterium CG10_big_fil_rev_8_21_14_0_10_44_23 TaxID=1974585 RepID=A0A2H0UQK0_9BACT|nr:MAG: hypothetical protein COU09_01120 [Candidatus Harrisonbacteria bacterium CG10_big_fil_rev_8_21_14_0_10_44_23]